MRAVAFYATLFLALSGCVVLARQGDWRAESLVTNQWVEITKLPTGRKTDVVGVICIAPKPIVYVPIPAGHEESELGETISQMKSDWKWFVPQNATCQPWDYKNVRYQIMLESPVPKARFVDDAAKLDPKHNEILFENQIVRVARVHFPPGESGPMVDKRARVIIMLTDSHATVTLPDGHSEVRDGKAGNVSFSKAGRQATNNVGTTPLENIVVELKSK